MSLNGPQRGAVLARVATGKRVSGEWPRPVRLQENTKKADVLHCCKTPAYSNNLLRSVSLSFPCESWQTEKLSGTDTSRDSPVFSCPGYGSLAVLANNPRVGRTRLSKLLDRSNSKFGAKTRSSHRLVRSNGNSQLRCRIC